MKYLYYFYIQIDIKYAKDKCFEQMTPEYVASLILTYFINCAEEELHFPIKKAVLTAPAYFNVNQRRSLLAAAELANIEVLKLVNEPTGIF